MSRVLLNDIWSGKFIKNVRTQPFVSQEFILGNFRKHLQGSDRNVILVINWRVHETHIYETTSP